MSVFTRYSSQTLGFSNIPIAASLYGTCSTAANTAEKAVTCSAYDLTTPVTGMAIAIKFTNSNTVSGVKLNINSTGAKNAYKYGTTDIGITEVTSWSAGSVVLFVFDGTNWLMADNQNVTAITTSSIDTICVTS